MAQSELMALAENQPEKDANPNGLIHIFYNRLSNLVCRFFFLTLLVSIVLEICKSYGLGCGAKQAF